MVDALKVADLLVSHTVKTHGDEVDLIAYYGSYAKGSHSAAKARWPWRFRFACATIRGT